MHREPSPALPIDHDPPTGPDQSHAIPGRAQYTLFLLTLVYILGYLDRQIINILAEPIKTELGLADWQLGVLTGFAFAIFYATLGIPIARVADRWHRPWLISISLAIWSIFTVACGAAQTFVQLALARFGVGIGEAGGGPPAFSLIADVVPVERRASAVGLYSLGIPIGTLLGLMIGGIMVDHYGWRLAFVLVGAPGVVLAIVVAMTLPEPRRAAAAKADDAMPLSAVFALIRSKPAFFWITCGTTLITFVAAAPTPFLASFYLRSHLDGIENLAAALAHTTGIALGAHGLIGTALGVAVGIGGSIGTYVGGRWTDRWALTDRRAYVFVPMVAVVTSAPFLILAVLVASPLVSFGILVARSFCGALAYGPAMGSTQTLVPPRARATAAAVMILFWNLVGFGLGPVVVGALSDVFAAASTTAEGLRMAIIASQAAVVLAAYCFYRAGRTFRSDWVG